MLTQRLVNNFPEWTKIRTDRSSLGWRMFSVWGDYFDWAHADAKRLYEDTKLVKYGLGLGYIWEVPLLEESYMASTLSTGGELIWTYPVVTGTSGVTPYSVTRVESAEELLWSIPTRITQLSQEGVDNFIVYSDDRAGTVVNNTIEYPSTMMAKIGTSVNFYKRGDTRNIKASGLHRIIIEGKDINGIDITEVLTCRDDGVYRVKNIFSEITDVIPEGFDGPIELSIGKKADYIVDPYRTCVVETIEGFLKLSIEDYTSGSVYTALRYYTDILKKGEDYRDGAVEVSPNDEEAWEQTLLDSTGAAIQVVDIAINPNTTRLYAVDTAGVVHIYDQGPTVFTALSLESSLTLTAYLDLLPVKQYGRLGESVQLFTRWVRMRFPLIGVTIKRVSPAGVTEYLQADKSWAVGVYEFPGVTASTGLVEDSWKDFSFSSVLTEFGQWEFYATARTKYDTTVSSTGIMADGLTALTSIATSIAGPLAIWFSHTDDLVISSSTNGPAAEANSFYIYQEHGDYYLADPSNQVLFLREEYDSVEVV